MKKFKFRLEKVLEYRETIKDEKQRDLIIRNTELSEAQDKLKEFENSYFANTIQGGSMAMSEYELQTRYSQRLVKMIAAQKEAIIEVEKLVEEAREAYLQASLDAESLVTLRENKQVEFDEKVRKAEEAMLEELAVQQGNRSRNNKALS